MRRRVGAGILTTGAAVAVAMATLSACGGGGSQASTSLAGSTVGASASSTSTDSRAAYRDCLTQHGATLPTRAPGGGGGNSSASPDPQLQAAMQACASLRPAGGNNKGGTALTAFRNCMSQQGAAIPTTKPTASPTAKPTGDDRYLNGLNSTDPKVAAALKICTPLLPTHSPKPSDSASAMS